MAIKQALGRGLSALIPDAATRMPVAQPLPEKPGSETLELPLIKIKPNAAQPRKTFDDAKLEELKKSIQEKGVLQPILVRPVGDAYQIIAGERRYRAAKALGLATIPALIKKAQDSETLQMALIENIQRQDLNPIEEARAYDSLIKEFHWTQEAVAKAVGKERSSVANSVRLLALSKKVQEKIAQGLLSSGHAKVLLGLQDMSRQDWLCEKILKEGLTVRQAEELLRLQKPSKTLYQKAAKASDPHLQFLEEELQRTLGSRVKILPKGKGGKLEIDYYSGEDLERILSLLGWKKPF